VERELLMTGIGGQGVQLAGQLLARAAVSTGRQVLMFGSYGGMMRGGNTDVTLILADSAVKSPPTVSRAWSALVMHSAFAVGTLTRLCPDGILIVNTTVLTELPDHPPGATVAIPAGGVAIELGIAAAATMVALGRFAGPCWSNRSSRPASSRGTRRRGERDGEAKWDGRLLRRSRCGSWCVPVDTCVALVG
jgi:Pyruvate/2-oxoacid:ferredoxin oxidoreductase gamma subunit